MSSPKAVRLDKFRALFTAIRDDLLDDSRRDGLPDEALEWYRKNLDYNVPHGKLNRGLSVVDSAEILKGRELTDEEFTKAAVAGWCIELLQAFFLVSDDIMDASLTRRGQPCWYLAPAPVRFSTDPTQKHPLVGNMAVNDAFILEGAIFQLLRKHFRADPAYIQLLELFHDCTYKTELGQLVDLITAPEGVVDLKKFSLQRHSLIVKYKTAFYSFYLPVAAALAICHIPESYTLKDGAELRTVRPYDVALDILIPIGEYFQIQDDFLDYSASPETLGKIGTDIVDNKCSWCINTALNICSPEQVLVLERNYGRKGDIEAGVEGSEDDKRAEGQTGAGGLCEQRIKEVYEAINLRKVYAEYEENAYRELTEKIAMIPENGIIVDDNEHKVDAHDGLKREVFTSCLEKIYRRSK